MPFGVRKVTLCRQKLGQEAQARHSCLAWGVPDVGAWGFCAMRVEMDALEQPWLFANCPGELAAMMEWGPGVWWKSVVVGWAEVVVGWAEREGPPFSGDPNTHRSLLCPGTPMPRDPLPEEPPALGTPCLGPPPCPGTPPAWGSLCPGTPLPGEPPTLPQLSPNNGQGMQGDPNKLGRGWRRPQVPPALAVPPRRLWGKAVPTGSQPPRPSAAPSGWGSPGTVPVWGGSSGCGMGRTMLLSTPATSPARVPFISCLSNGNFNARGRRRKREKKITKKRKKSAPKPHSCNISAAAPASSFLFFFFFTRHKSQGNQSYCTRRSRNSAMA